MQAQMDSDMGGPALSASRLWYSVSRKDDDQGEYHKSTETWMEQTVSNVSALSVGVFLVPYLQVTIRGRGRVVLAAPAPRLGPPTPACSVIQLFNGRWGALHCVKVPWEWTQTRTGHLKTFKIYEWSNVCCCIKAPVMMWFQLIPQVLLCCIHFRKSNNSGFVQL